MNSNNLLITVALVAIATLAFMPVDAQAQVGDNYFMEVLDTNDVAVGDIEGITFELYWVRIDPPDSDTENVNAGEPEAGLYQANVDGMIPEGAVIQWWRFYIPSAQNIQPWNPTTNNPIPNQDPAEFEVTITVVDNR